MKNEYYLNEQYNQIDLSWFFPDAHHRKSYDLKIINDSIEHQNKKFRNKEKRP